MEPENQSTDETRRSVLKKTAVVGTAATGFTLATGSAVAGGSGSFKSTRWKGINQGNRGVIVVDVGDVAVADSFNNWDVNVLNNVLTLNVGKVEIIDHSTIEVLTQSLDDNEIGVLNDLDVDIRVCALCSKDGKKYCGTCTA